MKSELLGTFYNDMLARVIPTNHMLVFWALEETRERRDTLRTDDGLCCDERLTRKAL